MPLDFLACLSVHQLPEWHLILTVEMLGKDNLPNLVIEVFQTEIRHQMSLTKAYLTLLRLLYLPAPRQQGTVKRVYSENSICAKDCPNICLALYCMSDTLKNEESIFPRCFEM